MTPTYDLRCPNPKCGARDTRRESMAKCNEQVCMICGTRMAVVIKPVGLSARRHTEGKGRSA